MEVTVESLQKHGAYSKDIEFFKRAFPSNAKLIQLIQSPQFSKEFLYWIRESFHFEEQEQLAYNKTCNIINTTDHWYSMNVKDSARVVKSEQVSNSFGIFNSIEVTNSSDIVESDTIDNCRQIFYSSMVEGSVRVLRGKNIVNSSNVIDSTGIINASSIIKSSGIFNSTEIIRGTNTTNSHFCKDCKNIKNCLFCDGIENAEYHIFNLPVDKEWYDQFAKQYAKYQNEELFFLEEWPQELITTIMAPPINKYDSWCSQIPQKFWKWARTLPGYDEMFLYNMTMLPEILMD